MPLSPKPTTSLTPSSAPRLIHPDSTLAARIESWFTAAARPMPWRITPRDPYLSLVSEFMLQQTQAARVVPIFERFIRRFPTLSSLAAAPPRAVLAAWTGLGYYRRAALLHAAARQLAPLREFPSDAESLRALPGIGPYTAGALASIVFDRPEPIVDANVARVLLRLHARKAVPSSSRTTAWTWSRATALVRAARSPAALNEGLMELGALICTPPPRAPRCDACPLRSSCLAHALSLTDSIPTRKPPPERQSLFTSSALVVDSRSRILLQRRPAAGLWPSMLQSLSLERPDRFPTCAELADAFALPILPARPRLSFTFLTSHRSVRFRVYLFDAPLPDRAARSLPRSLLWRSRAQLAREALPSPHRRIISALAPARTPAPPPPRSRTPK